MICDSHDTAPASFAHKLPEAGLTEHIREHVSVRRRVLIQQASHRTREHLLRISSRVLDVTRELSPRQRAAQRSVDDVPPLNPVHPALFDVSDSGAAWPTARDA